MTEGNRAPNLLPAALILGILLWIYTTTGGGQILVNEVLSEAYDSQAEHFLRGDVGVDGGAIRHEVMVVDGKARMYFGPFPALLRIPLNHVYPSGRGHWSRWPHSQDSSGWPYARRRYQIAGKLCSAMPV